MRWVSLVLWVWAFVAGVKGASPGWRWSNPAPFGATIFDASSNGSLAVVVGEFGQVFTSDNLDDWMPRKTGVTNSLRAVEFFGGRLVVTAAAGVILYTQSDALSAFNKVNLGTEDWLEGLTIGNGLMVAVGDNGAIYTSTNGASWQRRQPDREEWLTSVAYGGGKFVAVGYAGFVTTSNNGLDWTAGTRITTTNLNKVTWLGDRFWVLGEGGLVRTSDTGLNWTTINSGSTNDLYDAASDGTEAVLVGTSELRTSLPPYSNWTSKIGQNELDPPLWTYYAAHWDGSQFLVAGRSGMLVEGFRTNATAATDWFVSSNSPRNWIWSLTHLDGLFFACGADGGVFTSVDGFRFNQEETPLLAQSQILEGIGGTTNMLLAVGTGGTILFSEGGYTNAVVTNISGQVLTQQVSTLGIQWTAATLPLFATTEFQGVGVLGSRYIVTGSNGTIVTSEDGKTWTARSSGVQNFMLSGVGASATRAVAVGDFGSVTTSDNGTSWTKRSSGVTNWIYQVKYLNGQFVAVGEEGLILTSPDGTSWTRRSSGTDVWLNAVAYVGGNYFTVGTGGTILKSADAITWAQLPRLTTKSFYGVAGNAGRIVVAGVEGAILRGAFPPATPPPVDFLRIDREGSGVVFLFKGELDQRFSLLGSSDFTNWDQGTELEIIDNSGGLIFFQALGRTTREFFQTKVLLE